MNLAKLLSKRRLAPIFETRSDGVYVVGYERPSNSRKHGRWMLKNPQKLAAVPAPKAQNAEPTTAAAAAGGAS